MNKKGYKINKLLLLLFLIISSSQLILAQNYPTITPYVNDFGNYLTPSQIGTLNARCQQIEQNTSYEIALVTVTTTNGDDRLDYANKIGEQNGVGKKDKDNGLVVLWTQENEQGLAIAVGRGAESIFNDAKVSRIARDARPLFNEKKYYEGFNQILDNLESEISTNSTGIDIQKSLQDNSSWIIGLIIVLIIFWLLDKYFLEGLIIGGLINNLSNVRVGSGGGSFGGGSFSGGGGKG